jgi:anti-sigma B factor antagonist
MATVAVSEPSGEVVTISVSGELDISSVPPVQEAVDLALASSPQLVVFELADLRFMDSSGIAMLLSVAQRVSRVVLRRPSEIVRRIIDATGLAEALPVEDPSLGSPEP